MESRGCTAVAAFVSERKAGLGADFGVRFANFLLLTYALMTLVFFSLSSLAILGDGEVLVCLVSGSRRQ